MTDEDIRTNKKILRDEHLTAKEALATLYSNTRRIGQALQMHGVTLQAVPEAPVLPKSKEHVSNGNSIDGLNLEYLQGSMDDIAKMRAHVKQLEGELKRLHVEFEPFGIWP